MKLPTPEPGLVIRYSYLWAREHKAGRDEGTKDRPCAIVLAAYGENKDQVLVVPITHVPPEDADGALELPQDVKRLLHLDDERSWVVLSESNLFRWPGPDLRPSGKGLQTSIVYGLLPPKIFAKLRQRFLSLEGQRKTMTVQRSE